MTPHPSSLRSQALSPEGRGNTPTSAKWKTSGAFSEGFPYIGLYGGAIRFGASFLRGISDARAGQRGRARKALPRWEQEALTRESMRPFRGGRRRKAPSWPQCPAAEARG